MKVRNIVTAEAINASRLVRTTNEIATDGVAFKKCGIAIHTVHKPFVNPWTRVAPGYQTNSPVRARVRAYVIDIIASSNKVREYRLLGERVDRAKTNMGKSAPIPIMT